MATVPIQQTPSVNLDVGQAPLFSPTNIQPVQDTGTVQGINNLSKAQKQFAQIAVKLQDERNDSVSNQLSNEYAEKAQQIENEYLALELGAAVEKVGTGDDNKPIFKLEETTKRLTELQEEIGRKTENNDQLKIFNNKTSAKALSSANRITKHSLIEGAKFSELNTQSDINSTVKEIAASVDDFETMGDSEYIKNLLALDVKIRNLAEKKGINFIGDSKGSTEDSELYTDLKNKYLNTVHDLSIAKLMQTDQNRDVIRYLAFHETNSTIADAQLNKYIKTAITGLNKENGQNIAQNITNYTGNPNSGTLLDSIEFLSMLPSGNNEKNSNGFLYIEGATQEQNFLELETEIKDSKFYNLPQEHRTTFAFFATKMNVSKANTIFSKANKLLKNEGLIINKEKIKTDAKYATEINTKIMEKIQIIGKEEITNFFDDNNESELINKDLDYVLSQINYNYKNDLQPLFRRDEYGVIIEQDGLSFIRNFTDNKSLLEYAEAEIKSDTKEKIDFAEENYKINVLQPSEEKAYAEPGGWKNIEPILLQQLKTEDLEKLKKGFSKTNDINTLLDIEKGKINITDENADNYQSLESLRHLMTEKKYFELATDLKNAKSGSGSGSGSGSYTIDTTMFDKNLQQYQIETNVNLLKDKNDEQVLGNDYLDIKYALKNKILEFEKENKAKPNYQQKEALLQELLTDRVFTKSLGSKFGYGNKPVPISAINTNQMKRIFVKVGRDRIFMKDIPDAQELLIIDELNKANIPVTQYKIAEYWVKAGKPKTDSLVETTQGIGEIKGSTYGLMGG